MDEPVMPSLKLIKQRIKKLDWSEERARSTPVEKQVPRSNKINAVKSRRYRAKIKRMAAQLLGRPVSKGAALRLISDFRAAGVIKNLTKMARKVGLSRPTVASRINRGMSLEEALKFPSRGLPAAPRREARRGDLIYSGWAPKGQHVPGSVRGEAIRLGLNVDTVGARIKRGWTKEEALELVPRRKWSRKKEILTEPLGSARKLRCRSSP